MMTIISKKGETLNFREAADGIYIMDRPAFAAPFNGTADDPKTGNAWEESTGRSALAEWAASNLPVEVLLEYRVDIPEIEELYPQRLFDALVAHEPSGTPRTSRRLPLFADLDNLLMGSQGSSHGAWWWTRSPRGDSSTFVWVVRHDASPGLVAAYEPQWFVPVLRRRDIPATVVTKRLGSLTMDELNRICSGARSCRGCPIRNGLTGQCDLGEALQYKRDETVAVPCGREAE